MNKQGFWTRLGERLLPQAPDFGELLAEQCLHVRKNAHDLVTFLGAAATEGLQRLDANELEAARIRSRNMARLSLAFSTTFDREDIRRAIDELDWITVHLNRVPHEMRALDVTPDEPMRALGREILRGIEALHDGFCALSLHPEEAGRRAEFARKTERRARRIYEHGLATLFAGSDHIQMLKHRELYHHLADGAKRVHRTAMVLQDMVIKSA